MTVRGPPVQGTYIILLVVIPKVILSSTHTHLAYMIVHLASLRGTNGLIYWVIKGR